MTDFVHLRPIDRLQLAKSIVDVLAAVLRDPEAMRATIDELVAATQRHNESKRSSDEALRRCALEVAKLQSAQNAHADRVARSEAEWKQKNADLHEGIRQHKVEVEKLAQERSHSAKMAGCTSQIGPDMLWPTRTKTFFSINPSISSSTETLNRRGRSPSNTA
jgi:hypothetical protein